MHGRDSITQEGGKFFVKVFVNMRELRVNHTKNQGELGLYNPAKQRMKRLLSVNTCGGWEEREELFILKNNSWHKPG